MAETSRVADVDDGGRRHRTGMVRAAGPLGRLMLALAIAVGLVVTPGGAPAHAALSGVRRIYTTPFSGSSVEMGDNEGITYVPSDDRLWLVDDSPGRLYEVERTTGRLRQVISGSQLGNAVRFRGTERAGSRRVGDLESLAYDEVNDVLYAFSGSCCTSTARPTAFRLTRPSRSGAFAVESWQPLSSPHNDLSGASVRNGQLWVAHSRSIMRYDYESNTTSSVTAMPNGAIYSIGFGPRSNDLWLTVSGNDLLRYDWTTKRRVATYDMAGLSVRDARGVESIGGELYVSDGYDGYGSSSRAFAVRVISLGEEPPPAPVATFRASVTSGSAPLTVNFTDTSSNSPTNWSWSFGDGSGASIAQHPTHTFELPGAYSVVLTTTNAAGATTSAPTTITVLGGNSTSATFTPIDDGYTDRATPTTARCTGPTLYSMTSDSSQRGAYVMFNVAGSGGRPVTRAVLRMHVTDGSVDGSAWFRVGDTTWSESTLTWATAPPVVGAALGDPATVAIGQWLEVDVTAAVSGDGRVAFASVAESADQDRYSAREGTNPPQLVVTYG